MTSRSGTVGQAALELRMWGFGLVLPAIPFTVSGALAAGIAAAVREARGIGGGGASFAAWVFGRGLLFAHLVLWVMFGAIPTV
ncbi:hypothetical protein CA12_24170 [Alienimonas californiensis]|uniref:Uncharacterized protein n=2 Tax=Alienimonas californiensis TaxID=2527989 RepID=A0A517PAB6_9PLAN|nr:hypothetical protein CA12_24170 [Alienimonas californiensis]